MFAKPKQNFWNNYQLQIDELARNEVHDCQERTSSTFCRPPPFYKAIAEIRYKYPGISSALQERNFDFFESSRSFSNVNADSLEIF